MQSVPPVSQSGSGPSPSSASRLNQESLHCRVAVPCGISSFSVNSLPESLTGVARRANWTPGRCQHSILSSRKSARSARDEHQWPEADGWHKHVWVWRPGRGAPFAWPNWHAATHSSNRTIRNRLFFRCSPGSALFVNSIRPGFIGNSRRHGRSRRHTGPGASDPVFRVRGASAPRHGWGAGWSIRVPAPLGLRKKTINSRSVSPSFTPICTCPGSSVSPVPAR